uniref:Uncharacterized protein n=1 Tax=Anguilla anguilla TaxID=7936 RepID=A0A0E9RJN1_ANGAN
MRTSIFVKVLFLPMYFFFFSDKDMQVCTEACLQKKKKNVKNDHMGEVTSPH